MSIGIEKKLEDLEKKVNSVIELLSPNTNINNNFSDSFFDLQWQIKEAEETRVARYSLLLDFRNKIKKKYDNFLSAPKEEQELLDKLVLNAVYAKYIEDHLIQLSELYKLNFYQLLSGQIAQEQFIENLNEFINSRPKGFTQYGFDYIFGELAISKETDFYRILEEEAKIEKSECIEYINSQNF